MKDGRVTFVWKDYLDNNKRKIMTITAEEFIRRFLLHVLPKGFNKIRHFGYLGSRFRSAKLSICRAALRVNYAYVPKTTKELLERMGVKPYCRCAVCGSEKLRHCFERMNN